MWDWILICNVIKSTGFPISIILGLCLFVFLVPLDDMDDKDKWAKTMWRISKSAFLITFIISLVGTLGTLPEIVPKSNIDRVKIYYTSPKSIAQIESGALQVVDKLDKLIDKGIESIGKEEAVTNK